MITSQGKIMKYHVILMRKLTNESAEKAAFSKFEINLMTYVLDNRKATKKEPKRMLKGC